jgi:hypothetical protein
MREYRARKKVVKKSMKKSKEKVGRRRDAAAKERE